jgi:hypothetical protein
MIPSRDEPFGLVAVEFGRKGALGIGCNSIWNDPDCSASGRSRSNARLVVHHRVDYNTASPQTIRTRMSRSALLRSSNSRNDARKIFQTALPRDRMDQETR